MPVRVSAFPVRGGRAVASEPLVWYGCGMTLRLAPIACLLLGCGGDGHNASIDTQDGGRDSSNDAEDEVWQNDPRCPDTHPTMTPNGWTVECAIALECHWPAPGCLSGTKPDNVCTCGSQGWQCSVPFHNCLPISIEDDALAPDHRPAPDHRASTESCPDPHAESSAAICVARYPPGAGTCAANGECPDGEVCLDTHEFGSRSSCQCRATDCLVDADCSPDELCHCGTIDAGVRCDGWSSDTCGHRCLSATCRVDDDCGPNAFCSPSYDQCGWRIERWACHDPGRDECLSDAECAVSRNERSVCQATTDGSRWTCISRALCE